MGRSQYASSVVMPCNNPSQYETVLDFLIARFPRIDADIWRQRMLDGHVHWESGDPISETTPFTANVRVFYYREVPEEPEIPFNELIIHQDEELLVACKPHFLPVTPAGIYVQQCLLNRLREKTGIDELTPIHRIDRDTAGLVMFSVNPQTRGAYQRMFAEGTVKKTYQAVAACGDAAISGKYWLIENRMETAEQWFRMTITQGEINARSTVRCLDVKNGRALFELSPLTGKTHQLRVHMNSIGLPLENDRLYPEALPKEADDFGKPLQLLAREVEFVDPITGVQRQFQTTRGLNWSG
ncbi:pseudouridine synthase [Pontibacterium granulatum]|uniref:pseudouridine synthase n=1 Tax=Pontibacterium granulatum TaxID=2036029 RepID=UPI00249B5A67|nr:pseudouridine synthase [Pontibacterium granulatum]MDI3325028.1 pseudouridine synthase [Pontibacterium granulatum]